MYKQIVDVRVNKLFNIVQRQDGAFIPFDPANTDYQNFKAQINADEAQLEDADGNVMSEEEAKQFISTLP